MFEDFVVMTPVQVLEFRVDTVPSFNLPWSQKIWRLANSTALLKGR